MSIEIRAINYTDDEGRKDKDFTGSPADAAEFAARHLPYSEQFLTAMFEQVEVSGESLDLGVDTDDVSWFAFAEKMVTVSASAGGEFFMGRNVPLSEGVKIIAAANAPLGMSESKTRYDLKQKGEVKIVKGGVTYTLRTLGGPLG